MPDQTERRTTCLGPRGEAVAMVMVVQRSLGVSEAEAAQLLGVSHESAKGWRLKGHTPTSGTVGRMAQSFAELDVDEDVAQWVFEWRERLHRVNQTGSDQTKRAS